MTEPLSNHCELMTTKAKKLTIRFQVTLMSFVFQLLVQHFAVPNMQDNHQNSLALNLGTDFVLRFCRGGGQCNNSLLPSCGRPACPNFYARRSSVQLRDRPGVVIRKFSKTRLTSTANSRRRFDVRRFTFDKFCHLPK